MQQLILTLHILVAIGLVSMILLQRGKGADVGASFGSGASTTVFGSAGATSFLFKVTATLATLFFATSIILGYMASKEAKTQVAFDISTPVENTQELPTQLSVDETLPVIPTPE